MLCAMVLKSTVGRQKTDGSLCARVLKSIDGRQYNGKRDREERQARHDEIKDQWISHEMENRQREQAQARFGR
jgi:hypothetical protein